MGRWDGMAGQNFHTQKVVGGRWKHKRRSQGRGVRGEKDGGGPGRGSIKMDGSLSGILGGN